MLERMWRNCWWECKLVQPLWRTVWRFLKKLELELPHDPAIPLLGIHTEETRRERDTCTPMFIAALFIIAKTWKQPRCPSADEWISKPWCIYTMEYYWSGVDELYNFLIGAPDFISNNNGYGPYATDAKTAGRIDLGDIIQLARDDGNFYHSLIITGFTDNDILVSAQSNDALDKPLSEYNYTSLRALHIEGAMLYFDDEKIYNDFLEGKEID